MIGRSCSCTTRKSIMIKSEGQIPIFMFWDTLSPLLIFDPVLVLNESVLYVLLLVVFLTRLPPTSFISPPLILKFLDPSKKGIASAEEVIIEKMVDQEECLSCGN